MLCVPPHLTFYVSARDPSSGPHGSMLNKHFTDWDDSPASHVLLETSSLFFWSIIYPLISPYSYPFNKVQITTWMHHYFSAHLLYDFRAVYPLSRWITIFSAKNTEAGTSMNTAAQRSMHTAAQSTDIHVYWYPSRGKLSWDTSCVYMCKHSRTFFY